MVEGSNILGVKHFWVSNICWGSKSFGGKIFCGVYIFDWSKLLGGQICCSKKKLGGHKNLGVKKISGSQFVGVQKSLEDQSMKINFDGK